MDVKRLTRKIRLDSLHTALKYQLITELVFLRGVRLTENDLIYLALLTEWGPMPLGDFCDKAVLHVFGKDANKDLDKHPARMQNIRNRVNLLLKRGLVSRYLQLGKKHVGLSPNIPIYREGNVLLDYNFLYVETKKDTESAAISGRGVPAL